MIKKSIIWMVFSFSLIPSCARQTDQNVINGVWGDSPSMGAGGVSFFVFFDDGVYKNNDYIAKGKFEASRGQWKIEGNSLYLLPQLNIWWERENVQEEGLPYVGPGEGKKAYVVRIKDPHWIKIGVIKGMDEDRPVLTLYYFEKGKLSKKPKLFYFYYPSEMIEEFSFGYRYDDVEVRN